MSSSDIVLVLAGVLADAGATPTSALLAAEILHAGGTVADAEAVLMLAPLPSLTGDLLAAAIEHGRRRHLALVPREGPR